MKTILATTLLALGLMAGCEGPIPAYQDRNAPLQVSVTDYWLQQDIRVSPHAERIPGGQLKVTVQIFNNTDHDKTVDYKYWFTDKSGIQVDNMDRGWELARLAPKGYTNVEFMSTSPAAEDFRVQIRPAK